MTNKLLSADVPGLLDTLLRQAVTPGPALRPKSSPEPPSRITYFDVELEGDELHWVLELSSKAGTPRYEGLDWLVSALLRALS